MTDAPLISEAVPAHATLPVVAAAGGSDPGWVASTVDAFRLPVYRTVWIGTIMSFFAFNTWGPAQGVVAFDLTGNNSAVGIVVFGQGLAQFILNPISGAAADRMSKRTIVVACQVLAWLTMISVATLILTHQINIVLLALSSFVVGSMFAFNGPARNALIGDLVPGEKLGNAIAMIQVGGNFARTAAPFVAGALLSWPLIGAAGTYYFMASVMFFVILTMYRIPASKPRLDASKTSVLEDVRLGFRYVAADPRLLHCVVSFQVVVVLGFSNFVLMPGFSKQVLHAGTAGVGILLGASAAGGIFTGLAVASMAGSSRVRVLLTLSSLTLGLALIGTGLAPTFAIAIAAMALVGAGSSAFQILNNVLAIRWSSQDYYGRVMAILFTAWGLQALSGLPIGLAADALGERAVLAGLGGFLCLATAALALWERQISRAESKKELLAAGAGS